MRCPKCELIQKEAPTCKKCGTTIADFAFPSAGSPIETNAETFHLAARMPSRWLKVIAFLEIGGGIVGIIGPFAFTPDLLSIKLGKLFVQLAFLLPMSLSIVAGVLLWKGTYQGLMLSRIVQGMQIPILIYHRVLYEFYTGLGLYVSLKGIFKIQIEPLLGAIFRFRVLDEPRYESVGINLIALLAFWYLMRNR